MPRADLRLTHMDRGVTFGHPNDERAFFEWLARIPCIATYRGDGPDGLVVTLSRPPRQDELRQLIALCHRWRVDMRQLARFETARNRNWLRNPGAYWHSALFLKGRQK
jgi:hypothetical protein